MTDLKKYVLGIRENLENIYNENWTDDEREEREEQGEACDLWEYLQDVLDVEYILDSSFNLIGCKVYVTLGGPSVHIDTYHDSIVGYWGSDKEEIYIDRGISDAINDYYEDLIRCQF